MNQVVMFIIFLLVTNALVKPTTTLNSVETTEFIDNTTYNPGPENKISYDKNFGHLLDIKNRSGKEEPFDQQVEEITDNPRATAEINSTYYDDQTEYEIGREATTEDAPKHDQGDENEDPPNVTNADVTTDASFISGTDEISPRSGEPLLKMKSSDDVHQTDKEETPATSFTKTANDTLRYGSLNNKQDITEFSNQGNKKKVSTENKSIFVHSSRPYVTRRMISDLVSFHNSRSTNSDRNLDYRTRFKEIGKQTKIPCTMRSRQKSLIHYLPLHTAFPFLPRITSKHADFKSYVGGHIKSAPLKEQVLKEFSSSNQAFSISSPLLKNVYPKLAKATYFPSSRLIHFDRNGYEFIRY